jgi:type I restriction enzyme, S subunit
MANKNWRLESLKELCYRIGDGLHGTPTYCENSDIYFINGNNLNNGRIEITNNTKTVANEDFERNFISLDNKSLLLSINGTLGSMAFYNGEKVMLGKSTAYLNFKSEINRFYFYYFQLEGVQQYFHNVATGSTIKNLSLKSIQEFEVPVPPEHEWGKIVNVLSTLDAKIELNNRINTELEAMAKTLYDYWFVQFDFPDANGKPYKTSGGKMIYNSELKREIPEGWEVSELSNWIKADKTGDWGKDSIEGNYTQKVYCFRGADINDLNGAGICTPPTRFILQKNLHKVLEPNDLIIEISGGSPTQSTGRMAFLTDDTLARFDAPTICTNFCKAITLKDKKYLYNFAFLWQRLYDHGVFFGYEGKTSGIKNFLFDSFTGSYRTEIPSEDIAEKFYEFMIPIQTKKQKALQENQELTELRDWLLPMLMNGKVTVAEAEEKVAMAAEPEAAFGKQGEFGF